LSGNRVVERTEPPFEDFEACQSYQLHTFIEVAPRLAAPDHEIRPQEESAHHKSQGEKKGLSDGRKSILPSSPEG
jgi:hypothetical protein